MDYKSIFANTPANVEIIESLILEAKNLKITFKSKKELDDSSTQKLEKIFGNLTQLNKVFLKPMDKIRFFLSLDIYTKLLNKYTRLQIAKQLDFLTVPSFASMITRADEKNINEIKNEEIIIQIKKNLTDKAEKIKKEFNEDITKLKPNPNADSYTMALDDAKVYANKKILAKYLLNQNDPRIELNKLKEYQTDADVILFFNSLNLMDIVFAAKDNKQKAYEYLGFNGRYFRSVLEKHQNKPKDDIESLGQEDDRGGLTDYRRDNLEDNKEALPIAETLLAEMDYSNSESKLENEDFNKKRLYQERDADLPESGKDFKEIADDFPTIDNNFQKNHRSFLDEIVFNQVFGNSFWNNFSKNSEKDDDIDHFLKNNG